MLRASLLAVVLLGCSSQRSEAVTLREPRNADSAAAPTATPSARPTPPGNACVMLYECGCNAGCTEIDQPLANLTAGKRIGVTSGPLKGTSVYVVQNRTDDGALVFTVQRADPSARVQVCSNARSPLVGYGCSVKDSGAARACTTCE